MSTTSALGRSVEAVSIPVAVTMTTIATVDHAEPWTDGSITPPDAIVDVVHDHGPDVMIGAAAGTAASLLGSKAVEGMSWVLAWVSAPRKADVRRGRAELMANSVVARGVAILIGAAAGVGSGYGRGAGAMASGGLGGTTSGLLVTRKK